MSPDTNGIECSDDLKELLDKSRVVNDQILGQLTNEADVLKVDYWICMKARAKELKKLYVESGISTDPKLLNKLTFIAYSPSIKKRKINDNLYPSLYWGSAKYGVKVKELTGVATRRRMKHIPVNTRTLKNASPVYDIEKFEFGEINQWQKEIVTEFEIKMQSIRKLTKEAINYRTQINKILGYDSDNKSDEEYEKELIKNEQQRSELLFNLRDRLNKVSYVVTDLTQDELELLKGATESELEEHEINPSIQNTM